MERWGEGSEAERVLDAIKVAHSKLFYMEKYFLFKNVRFTSWQFVTIVIINNESSNG